MHWYQPSSGSYALLSVENSPHLAEALSTNFMSESRKSSSVPHFTPKDLTSGRHPNVDNSSFTVGLLFLSDFLQAFNFYCRVNSSFLENFKYIIQRKISLESFCLFFTI